MNPHIGTHIAMGYKRERRGNIGAIKLSSLHSIYDGPSHAKKEVMNSMKNEKSVVQQPGDFFSREKTSGRSYFRGTKVVVAFKLSVRRFFILAKTGHAMLFVLQCL